MKRQANSFTAIAAAAFLAGTSTLALTGCDEKTEEVEVKTYKTVAECVEGGNTQKDCQDAFESAQAANEKEAPRFESLADCEAQFGVGQCGAPSHASHNEHSNFFVPFMLGYMMSGGGTTHTYNYHSARPFYGSPRGGYSTSRGDTFIRGEGASARITKNAFSAAPERPSAVIPKGETIRGGFGSTGASKVGGGSSNFSVGGGTAKPSSSTNWSSPSRSTTSSTRSFGGGSSRSFGGGSFGS